MRRRKRASQRLCEACVQVGLTEGRDVRIDVRLGAGHPTTLANLAAELLALSRLDVILGIWRHGRWNITPGDPNCADRVYADC